ncbi:MAG: hypothetical protein AB7J28_04445 [Hyphomonadaceae bacterium]
MRLARGIYAGAVEAQRLRIVQLPKFLGFGAMVPFGRTIYFASWRAPLDFAEVKIEEQGWFIHELAHVWQARKGTWLAFAKLGALGKGAYKVPGDRKLKRMNIEAQAEVARLLFMARSGHPETAAPDKTELEALWAKG